MSRYQSNAVWAKITVLIVSVIVLNQSDVLAQSSRGLNDAQGQNGAIATGCQPAAEAGLEILKSGGNAADAAVATMLVQTVIENRLFCFGSEVPIIIYDKKRDVVEVIQGLGAAPKLATADWFEKNRNGVIQGRGDIANAPVPGFLDACITALERYGSKSFEECAAGIVKVLTERAAMTEDDLGRRFRGDRAAWIKHHKNFLNMINRLIQAEKDASGDRLKKLRAVSDYFYRGPIAREIDAWSRENGGLLRYHDFAQHQTRVEDSLAIQFNGYTVHKCNVWTQGPFLLQTLRLLETTDFEALEHGSADYIHRVTEAMKLAFADRDAYYGDPTFVDVPIDKLLSSQYTNMRRSLLNMEAASQVQQAGDPINMRPLLGVEPQDYKITSGHSDDTSNCLVADKYGNVVAATPSGWGGVIAGDTGVELGSRMIGLTAWEGHPSVCEPGKRPRITLTPTLIMKDGKPVVAISVAGGDMQDQASLQILLNRLVYDFDPLKAVTDPRFNTKHHINWFGHEESSIGCFADHSQYRRRDFQRAGSSGT